MIALIRIVTIFIYFILLNATLVIAFILRPMHRDNVHLGAQWYITMGRLIGLKLQMRISEKLKPEHSYLFISNHQNTYDLVTVAAAALPGTVTIGKKSLKWIPVFGLIYWLSGNIMIDRKDKQSARDTLEATAAKVNERNISIFMFPEGTRSRGRGILPFKTGAFRLAQTTKKSIVPVVCSNTNHIELGRWNNGTVIVEIMDPVDIDFAENPKTMAKTFEELIRDKFATLSKEAKQLA
ncbi:MAG: 1-acylglycerol-3-phosphate O-acyltransferase [Pseudomonadota bacterium]